MREKNARPVSKWLFFSVAFVRFVCFRQTRVVGGNVFPPRFHWVSNIFSTCIDQETKHPRGRRINLGIILAQTNFFRDQQVFFKISSKSFGLSTQVIYYSKIIPWKTSYIAYFPGTYKLEKKHQNGLQTVSLKHPSGQRSPRKGL